MDPQLIEQLQQRGLIAQSTELQALEERLAAGPITLYCGFDPTAESLHVGNLVPLLCLKRFQMAGHRPIILVGGATGMIGDPIFKTVERQLHSPEQVNQWVEDISRQVSSFVDFDSSSGALMVNNNEWFGQMKLIPFLRDIGKHFSVNAMLNKEGVRQRLQREESGISFTEFSYSLLQSYDYANLHRLYGVELQIGGSDQWGNITTGIELTRRLYRKTVFGLTLPLITKADGTKFGKSETGTVWLSPQKTSPYKFYQFWLNSSDADVYNFLRLFTFLSQDEILSIRKQEEAGGVAPQAQRILAEEVTQSVHGTAGLASAQRISQSLFAEDLSSLRETDFVQLAQDGLPSLQVSGQLGLQQALVAAKLAPSQTQARTMISAKAVSINSAKCTDENYFLQQSDRLHGRFTLLKRGKKHHCLLCWQ